MTNNNITGFADKAFEFKREECEFEDALCALTSGDFEGISWNEYDCSLVMYGAYENFRLGAKAQKFISQNGFMACVVRHVDDWETHYCWGDIEFEAEKGWRVRRNRDGNNNSRQEISYFPDSWPEEWRGDFDIVEDTVEWNNDNGSV